MAATIVIAGFLIFSDEFDADSRFTEGYFEFEPISGTDEVKIYGVKDKIPLDLTTLDIPSTVSHNGKEYTVTTVGAGGFSRVFFRNNVTVNIPETVTVLESGSLAAMRVIGFSQLDSIKFIGEGALSAKIDGVCHFGKNLEYLGPYSLSGITTKSFEIDPENPYFMTKDGVIYSADGTMMVQAPRKDYNDFTIPDGVTTILNNAMNECTIKGNLVISSDVEYIGDRAFSYGKIGGLTFKGNSLKYIGSAAFRSSTIAGELKLPDSLEYLGSSAFSECVNLTSIITGNSLEFIGSSAFDGCDKLKSIAIGNGVKVLSFNCFVDTAIEYLKIPASVEIIDLGIVGGCKNLKTIEFEGEKPIMEEDSLDMSVGETHPSVKIITNGWGDEYSLNRFVMGRTIVEGIDYGEDSEPFDVGDYRFVCHKKYGTAQIVGLSDTGNSDAPIVDPVLPSYVEYEGKTYVVTEIGKNAFYDDGVGLLEGHLTFPENLVTVFFGSFRECKITGTIRFPDTFENIGGNSFLDMTITGIDFGNCKLKTIGYCAFMGAWIKNLVIPDTVKTISIGAFESCPELETVDIGNGVVKATATSFHNCGNLKTVKFGGSLRYIEANAFGACPSLSCNLYFGPNMKFIEENGFTDCFQMDGKNVVFAGPSMPAMKSLNFGSAEHVCVYAVAKNLSSPFPISYVFGINVTVIEPHSTTAPTVFLLIVALAIAVTTAVGIIRYKTK